MDNGASPSVFELVESGDRERLLELPEGESDLSARDKGGRTVLDLAALLGRAEVAQVLVDKGANVNLPNKSGYTALHLAAAWGQLECLRVLVSAGADHQPRTRHRETARDLAQRYCKTECVDYLDCVDARFQLSEAVRGARETLTDTEKISGKWNKDDKSKVTALCNEKSNWLEGHLQALLAEVEDQKRDFDQRMEPYLAKLKPPE